MPKQHANVASALAKHMAMCSRGASAYELGLFYRSVISETGVWRTQAELAKAMNVSQAHVSKSLAAARLPREIVALFGPQLVTFRLAASLNNLIDQIGLEHLLANAARLPNGALGTVEILTFLVAGERAEAVEKPRLCIIGRGKALRLEFSELDIVLPHLRQLERMIAWSISMILSEPAHGARRTRRYKRCSRARPTSSYRAES